MSQLLSPRRGSRGSVAERLVPPVLPSHFFTESRSGEQPHGTMPPDVADNAVVPTFGTHHSPYARLVFLSIHEALMLETVAPVRFHAAVTSGRTRPARIECEKPDGTSVEVIGKFSAGCDRGEVALAMEVVAACLADDLGLPIPQPYLLDMQPAFVATVSDAERMRLMRASNSLAFGSTEAGSGFRIWSKTDTIPNDMVPDALGVFCFDAFIVNADRREGNPNLLVKGREIRIIDHESSFCSQNVIGLAATVDAGCACPIDDTWSSYLLCWSQGSRAGFRAR
jgi:hypothetical protein